MRITSKAALALGSVMLLGACQGSSSSETEPSTPSTAPPPTTTTTILTLSDDEQAWCDLVSQSENGEAIVEAAIAAGAPGAEALEDALTRAGDLRSTFDDGDPAGKQVFETTLVEALFDWVETNGGNPFQQACSAAYESR